MAQCEKKGNWFNEIHDSNGKIRSHYEPFYSHWKSISISKQKQLHDGSKKLFSGDYFLDPLPRLITKKEFSNLKVGVEQRAKAIREFLLDYYSLGTRWRRIVPASTLRQVIARDHDECVRGKLNPKSIAFPFGPDIIRDRHGRWRVVEDSAGCLGGMGDLLASRKIMLKSMPKYRSFLRSSNDPREFFASLAGHFERQARKKGGIALLYLRNFQYESDHETQRLAKTFESLGVEVTTQSSRTRRLIIDETGAYFQTSKKRDRVGYIIVHSSPEQLDSSYVWAGLRSLCLDSKTPPQSGRLYRDMLGTLAGS